MRAAICHQLDGPKSIVVEEVKNPELKPGTVRVKIHYAALNFMDLLIIAGKYQFQPPLPFCPGHDGAGVIVEVGEGVHEHQVGDRVSVGASVGAFAEQIVVPEENLKSLPEEVSLQAGSAYRGSYCSALYALEHRGHLQAGEHLVVTGAAGGVGLAAVQMGHLMGAKITGIVSSEDKKQTVLDNGADNVIVLGDERLRDEIRGIVGKGGADVFLDTVGGANFKELLHCAAWDARMLVMGFAAGEIQKIPANLPLLKSASVIGVNYGAWQERDKHNNRLLHEKILNWVASGDLSIHIDCEFPLTDISEALSYLADRKNKGKVLISP